MGAIILKTEETIKEIIRLKFIMGMSYNNIAFKLEISKTTVINYIKQFENMLAPIDLQNHIVSSDMLKTSKKNKFPATWNKYVKMIIIENSKRKKRTLTDDKIRMIYNIADLLKTKSPTDIYNFIYELFEKERAVFADFQPLYSYDISFIDSALKNRFINHTPDNDEKIIYEVADNLQTDNPDTIHDFFEKLNADDWEEHKALYEIRTYPISKKSIWEVLKKRK